MSCTVFSDSMVFICVTFFEPRWCVLCRAVLCSSELVLCALKEEWNAVDYAITVGCEVVFCVQSRGVIVLVRCVFNHKVRWCGARCVCSIMGYRA